MLTGVGVGGRKPAAAGSLAEMVSPAGAARVPSASASEYLEQSDLRADRGVVGRTRLAVKAQSTDSYKLGLSMKINSLLPTLVNLRGVRPMPSGCMFISIDWPYRLDRDRLAVPRPTLTYQS